jgi:hypothetical protein
VRAWAEQAFASTQAGLYVLACTTLVGAALIALMHRRPDATLAPRHAH